MGDKICVRSYWYYRQWWHRVFRVKHVVHDCFPMEWRDTPIKRFNKWVAPNTKEYKDKGVVMGEQLTTTQTCKQKHTYNSNETARRAVRRRNKASGYNYLRKYQCNVCNYWHVTAQDEIKE